MCHPHYLEQNSTAPLPMSSPPYMIIVYNYSICFLSLFELTVLPMHTYAFPLLCMAFNQEACQGGWKDDRNSSSERGKINFRKAYGNNRIFNQISLEIPSYFRHSLQGSCFTVQNEFQ